MIECSKDIRQKVSVEKWREAKGRGTLNLIMRFGKTRVADMIIGKVFEKNPTSKILVLAPNEITYKNLNSNLGEFIPKDCFVNIQTINQFINYVHDWNPQDKERLNIDLLVLDEVHKLLTPESLYAISRINYKYILCLTGSKLNQKQIDILNNLKAPIVDSIDEETAIRNKWISDSVEYNLGIDLDEHDKIKYSKYSEQISETLDLFKNLYKRLNTLFNNNVFDNDFSLVLSCFTGIYYKDKRGNKTFIKPTIIRNMLADIMGWSKDMPLDNDYNRRINKYWNPDNIFERAKKFKDFVKQRNDILICNRPKINAVIEILKTNKVPTICFNESIAMVDTLADYFVTDGIPYHSAIQSRYVINPETGKPFCYKNGEPKKLGQISLKNLAIDGIKKGYYKYLFTAQSLNEGLTIENIEQVITTGGSCNSMTHNQRIARGKTYDYLNPNKRCIIINLYINDFEIDGKEVKSRDKQKLIQRQQDCDNIPIWINSIDEIFM